MPRSKIGVVAASEFLHLLKTKVFLFSLILVPALSLGLGYAWNYLENKPDLTLRRFAVLDRSGVLYESLREAASAKSGAPYEPILLKPAGHKAGDLRAAALKQVGTGALFAYLEIPAGLFDPRGAKSAGLLYYSASPSYGDLQSWLSAVLNREIRRRRYAALGVDPSREEQAEQPVALSSFSLAQTPSPAGAGAAAVDPAEILVPVSSMLLLLLMVMLTAPQMMSSVIEEKMSRISEVLLASVSPFDLMIGKLLACCGAAAVVGGIYLAGGLLLAAHYGYSGLISAQSVLYFAVFLILAVFLHGSLYMAVGAACSQPKDAQGMLAPLVIITMAPLVALNALIQDPSGLLARALSFFPLSAPFVMCFRLNSLPKPSGLEIALSIAVSLGATLGCVWSASRIFRIGLLAQGRAPGLVTLLRWVFAD
jgi:ABC-2 type transport system permease protein